MGYAVAHQVTLETEDCCNCGVVFAMPATMRKRFRETGGMFYCPNGHGQHYTETEMARYRKMLEEANQKNTRLAQQVQDAQRGEQEALGAALKAEKEAKRIRKRLNAGVCPCCNRTFENLARHMATKHKEGPFNSAADTRGATARKVGAPIKSPKTA